jgi:hypothetical protein
MAVSVFGLGSSFRYDLQASGLQALILHTCECEAQWCGCIVRLYWPNDLLLTLHTSLLPKKKFVQLETISKLGCCTQQYSDPTSEYKLLTDMLCVK